MAPQQGRRWNSVLNGLEQNLSSKGFATKATCCRGLGKIGWRGSRYEDEGDVTPHEGFGHTEALADHIDIEQGAVETSSSAGRLLERADGIDDLMPFGLKDSLQIKGNRRIVFKDQNTHAPTPSPDP